MASGWDWNLQSEAAIKSCTVCNTSHCKPNLVTVQLKSVSTPAASRRTLQEAREPTPGKKR